MSFKNTADNTASYSIDDPIPDVTDVEVQAVMDDMIAKNIFNTSGGDLVSVAGAKVTTTTINELI
jgi:hypothetical protein